jgi:hypothetical protein
MQLNQVYIQWLTVSSVEALSYSVRDLVRY